MQEFVNRPEVVSEASRHGWGGRYRQRERVMCATEVIDTTQQEHGAVDSMGGTGQRASATGQTVEPLTEGGIESFDVSGVDASALLGAGQ